MKRRTRRYYTEEEKSLMWDRWEKGETFGSITTQIKKARLNKAGFYHLHQKDL